MLALLGLAAAATLASAAPAASSLSDAAGPVTTGVFSAVSSIQSFATPLIPSGASVASGASSVFSGGIPTRSFATSASFASSMGNMSMPSTTMMSTASMASSTATGAAGGVGGVGSANSSSNGACSTSSFPASATSLPTAAPTGQVIQGDYSGKYRPQVHFSPPKGFMNDPNGCHRDQNGTYHLYYQYNPFQYVAGNQHWGHATSQDLYNWTNQPIAIFPPNSTTQVFSGSAVLDPNNTSGFFPNQTDGVVAVYTLNSPTLQVQEIAYSRDGGYSFTPYDGNPVLDVGSNQFRDPKVFRYQDHWVMAVAYANDYTVGIFTSQNLTSWDHQSNFTHYGLLGLAYECPNLIEVPFQDDPSKSAWVMFISINPGAPIGGSASQYFIGDFDGKEFKPYDSAMRLADFAKDNYAGQWFADTESRESISIAWASNWQYTQSVPTADEGFRSAMSLPRRNYLTNITRLGWDLVSLPYDLSPIVNSSLASSVSVVNNSKTVDFSSVESNAVYFSLNVSLPDAVVKNASLYSAGASVNITFLPSNSSCSSSSSSSNSGSQVPAAKIVYFYSGLTNGAFALERPSASSSWGNDNPFFTDKFSYTLVDPLTSLEGVFDRSLLEVFLNRGAHSATMLVYPDEEVGSMKVETQDLPEGTTVQLSVNGLKSTWQTQ